MKLLRILCECEDFYKFCKHNYYPENQTTKWNLHKYLIFVIVSLKEQETTFEEHMS